MKAASARGELSADRLKLYRSLSRESLEAMLRFANAAAYLVTTEKGAIRSMPEPEDVEKILQAN